MYFYPQFFVAADPTVKNDRLWHDKYSLRKSMIPTFISTDQARKVSHLTLIFRLLWGLNPRMWRASLVLQRLTSLTITPSRHAPKRMLKYFI